MAIIFNSVKESKIQVQKRQSNILMLFGKGQSENHQNHLLKGTRAAKKIFQAKSYSFPITSATGTLICSSPRSCLNKSNGK